MNKNKKLRLEILDKMSTLAMAGFGLVAALAWNSAIQDLFEKVNIFGARDGLAAKFIYAIIITIIIVFVTYYLGRAINRLKDETSINDNKEGK